MTATGFAMTWMTALVLMTFAGYAMGQVQRKHVAANPFLKGRAIVRERWLMPLEHAAAGVKLTTIRTAFVTMTIILGAPILWRATLTQVHSLTMVLVSLIRALSRAAQTVWRAIIYLLPQTRIIRAFFPDVRTVRHAISWKTLVVTMDRVFSLDAPILKHATTILNLDATTVHARCLAVLTPMPATTTCNRDVTMEVASTAILVARTRLRATTTIGLNVMMAVVVFSDAQMT